MHEKIDMDELDSLVDIALSARNISRENNPFGTIYSDASRYVPSGVHASAFKRLEEVGPNLRKIFELVYLPRSPSALGLDIHLGVVTPISGTANVEALASKLGVANLLSEDKVATALKLARLMQRPLTDEEFLDIIHS
ncbi:MAG: hypothetical protein UX19_C0002G0062 [Candidatus Woesebacteria bacterium GW2011_GWA1_45_8]|uniref:Uncharacterized protein n=1 Tax=Candidatus Woesebacteria bacterium GW2011_GWA1_45_8 TaxID=1618559 RepID=A0A0G1QUM0_9BACT|nr:MAG: hypothetical protein UX19_C0002G0062 [Candidatus Woesebacteria bacterium GW2011_GWA1_45_8]